MQTIRLRKGGDRRVLGGHLWVFSNEIEGAGSAIEPGEDVTVLDSRGRLVGSGTYNPHSLIAVRLHARGEEAPLDAALLGRRVEAAWSLRRRLFGDGAQACRAVFAEGDGLPGLIVDRYGQVLVAQVLSAGMERHTDALLDALERTHRPEGIVLRNDSPAREHEGLTREVRLGRGAVPQSTTFALHGLTLAADLWGGQKTGFFFDQRRNYRLLQSLVPGARVLDAFCYSGAWGLHAAQWGARSVEFVDRSEGALEMVRRNAEANGFGNSSVHGADVLEFLKADTEPYDVVVLDPPAYAKNRRSTEAAARGYLNLNKWGLRRVKPGGWLVTCSCSHHVSPEKFQETVALAAREAGREVRVLAAGTQSPDHPWVPAMPETAYLKALLLQAW